MKRQRALFLTMLMTSFLLSIPSHSVPKADPKIVKECDNINATFDRDTFWLMKSAPLSKNRDLAMQEIVKNDLDPSAILIDCELIDRKSWITIKKDYQKVIQATNTKLRKIAIKYNFEALTSITCMKNGKKRIVEAINPKCPFGYKKIY